MWTERDKLLALALFEHEAGLHACGHPRSVAFSPHADAWYSAGTVTCHACAAIDRFQRDAHARSRPLEPGTVLISAPQWQPHERPKPWDGWVDFHDD